VQIIGSPPSFYIKNIKHSAGKKDRKGGAARDHASTDSSEEACPGRMPLAVTIRSGFKLNEKAWLPAEQGASLRQIPYAVQLLGSLQTGLL
jgi:hypothetical protein